MEDQLIFIEVPKDCSTIFTQVEKSIKQVKDDSKQGWHMEKDGFHINLHMMSKSKNDGKWSHVRGVKTIGKNIFLIPVTNINNDYSVGYILLKVVSQSEFMEYIND